jgi:hypothetical protein
LALFVSHLSRDWSLFSILFLQDYKLKAGLKQEDLRRRREEQQVEIRRQTRAENIAKRRNLTVGGDAVSSDEEEIGDENAGVDMGLDTSVRTTRVGRRIRV